MSNRVRYAWGHSPFGDFIVATVGDDLVAFEYPRHADDAVDALRRRFPDLVIEEDAAGLKSTVAACAHFVDHPDRAPEDSGAAR